MTPANQVRTTAIQASALGARLFRVNVGLAWVGEIIQKSSERITLAHPRPFKAGVKGMSDSCGFVPVVVTQEMVGRTIPIFLAIESKSGSGRPSVEQKAFITMVRKFGGRAGISRSPEDTKAIVAGEIRD